MSEENILSLFTTFLSKNANYAADTPDDLPGQTGQTGPRISSQFGILNNPNKSPGLAQGNQQQAGNGFKPITDTSKPLKIKSTSSFTA
jgi:hypothetical protein